MSHVSCRWLLLLPMLTALTLTACGSPQATDGDGPDRRRTGLLMPPVEAEQIGYGVNWIASVDVPPGQRIVSATRLDDLIITLERPTNMVSAVSVSDGQVRWRNVMSRSPERLFAPTRRDNRIYINSGTQLITLNARTGEVLALLDLPAAVAAPHTLIGNHAIFGGVDGRVFAVDVRNGQIRWTRQLSGRISAAPADAGDATVVVDDAGRYAMYDVRNGSLRWPVGRTFGRNSATPAVDDERVYIPSHDQALYAVDRQTGRDHWIYRDTVPLRWDPKLIGPTLFLPVPDDSRLVALDPEQGEPRWTFEENAIPLALPRDDRVLLATPTRLHVVRQSDGQSLAEGQTRPLLTVVAGPDHSLILVAGNGHMSRLNPRR